MATTYTDTTVNNLVINKMTKAEYDALQSKSDTELYLVPDEIDNVPTSGSDNPVKSGGVYTALSGKQNTLSTQTAYTSKGSATKVPQITTNALGQVTEITEVNISIPDPSNKADKVQNATNGNLAGLDSSGNLNDSGIAGNDVAILSSDNGVGIVPKDGIRVETVSSAAAISVNPDVVTLISGAVGTAAITLQVPSDNLAHVWDILMTTDSSVSITIAMSASGSTIKYPADFAISASKSIEISVIGTGTTYYLRYGQFT